jgi:hypothetical protein
VTHTALVYEKAYTKRKVSLRGFLEGVIPVAIIIDDVSRTFHEYLLLPGLTEKDHLPANVSLKARIQRYRVSEGMRGVLNIPFASAAMTGGIGPRARDSASAQGGAAFIFLLSVNRISGSHGQ